MGLGPMVFESIWSKLERIDPYWWLRGPTGNYSFDHLTDNDCVQLFLRVASKPRFRNLAWSLWQEVGQRAANLKALGEKNKIGKAF